eukprot:PhM_4_TR7807/c0_g1_i1/m.3517
MFPFPPAYPDFEYSLLMYTLANNVNAFNTVITYLKFLQYLRISERLGILTRTFSRSSEGLIGILFLFFLVVLAFALSGIAMYGASMTEFKNMNTALATMMKMLVGQFDYLAMKEENPELTAWYFWSYEILAMFLLLNFILALVSNSFAEENSNISLVPLDVICMRQIEEIKQLLHPTLVKNLVILHSKKKTRASLLQEVLEALHQHIELMDIDDLNTVTMFSTDFRTWLPEATYNDLNERYIALMWENMRFHYDLDHQTDSYMAERRLGEAIDDAVLASTSMCEGLGEFVVERVDTVKANVNHVVALLRRRKLDEEEM